MPKGYPKDPDKTRELRSLAGKKRRHTEEEKKKIALANSGPHPWAKGVKHPADCNHCKVIRARKGFSSSNKGNKHPEDCKHCAAARMKNPSKGRPGRISPYLGAPVECYNGCGKKVWPRGMKRHLHFCDGNQISDGENDYGPYWNCIRRFIYRRDGYTCQGCGKKAEMNRSDRTLVAHHMVPFKIVKIHEEPNLITLCRGCHIGWHNYANGVEGRMPNVH